MGQKTLGKVLKALVATNVTVWSDTSANLARSDQMQGNGRSMDSLL